MYISISFSPICDFFFFIFFSVILCSSGLPSCNQPTDFLTERRVCFFLPSENMAGVVPGLPLRASKGREKKRKKRKGGKAKPTREQRADRELRRTLNRAVNSVFSVESIPWNDRLWAVCEWATATEPRWSVDRLLPLIQRELEETPLDLGHELTRLKVFQCGSRVYETVVSDSSSGSEITLRSKAWKRYVSAMRGALAALFSDRWWPLHAARHLRSSDEKSDERVAVDGDGFIALSDLAHCDALSVAVTDTEWTSLSDSVSSVPQLRLRLMAAALPGVATVEVSADGSRVRHLRSSDDPDGFGLRVRRKGVHRDCLSEIRDAIEAHLLSCSDATKEEEVVTIADLMAHCSALDGVLTRWRFEWNAKDRTAHQLVSRALMCSPVVTRLSGGIGDAEHRYGVLTD